MGARILAGSRCRGAGAEAIRSTAGAALSPGHTRNSRTWVVVGALCYQTCTYDNSGFTGFSKSSQEMVTCLWVNDWLVVLKIPEL